MTLWIVVVLVALGALARRGEWGWFLFVAIIVFGLNMLMARRRD